MGIGPQVDSDFKAALKAKDHEAVSCLRMIRAALKAKEKDLQRPLEVSEELQVLGTMCKQRRESIDQFGRGGRQDLVDKESAELALIERYLPAQLSPQEIRTVLEDVIGELHPQGLKDMGQVMKAAMARLQGKADGKLVNQLVRQLLSG